ncbi:uncharacterized protein LOC127011601 [Drosophila biarmipes]|uniref:uncharacterized protein LOC127011601 n=1 Tax=Drosophila biarmipes TaxID=125945 RepID=UPI0021CC7E4C|nr:uncharacterized protein LOC127011601 [Drosophila biarmipes]
MQCTLRLWRDHFSKLLAGDDGANSAIGGSSPIPPIDDNVDIPLPNHDEVRVAKTRLKNNKATGADGLPAELFKAGVEELIRCMHQLLCRIWLEESMSNDWNLSVLCPVLKKGDPTICVNYRGISLITISHKVLSSVICERLKPYTSTLIGPYQCGFRPAAFDSPMKERLYATMSEFGIPAMVIRLCRITLSSIISSVKVGTNLSEPFNTVRGFRQGDPLSCDLFNFVMKGVLRKAGVHRSGTIFYKSVQLLAYADDIDIIGRSKRDVTAAFSAIEKESAKVGLAVNEGKTKYMLSTSRESRRLDSHVVADSYTFEVFKGVHVPWRCH